jgi:acyl-CoA thioesterase II
LLSNGSTCTATTRFHHEFRADEWLLYEMESPAASGGRGLAFGRLYNRQGLLVCTVAQEGLIRKVKSGVGLNRGFKAAPPLRQSKL